MKLIKEKLLNLWWKYRGRKKSNLITEDIFRYGRAITVVRYHDHLLVVCEGSIWQVSESFDSNGLEVKLITNRGL